MTSLRNATEQAEADRAYYRRIAEEYFQRHEQPIQQYSTRVESRWLRELIPTGSRVLLVGVGGGRELGVLLDRDCRVTALDYSEEMIEAGRHHWTGHAVDWVLGDAHNLEPFRDSFDAVISLAAINYFIDSRQAMHEMARALVPGGRLIVSSINALHRSERGIEKRQESRKVTRQLYAPADLKRLATDAGLTVELVRGIRYLADLAPVHWNHPGASWLQRATLRAIILTEPLLQRLRSPDRAKFFWLVARR